MSDAEDHAPDGTAATTLRQWLQARYPTAKVQTLRRMLSGGRVTINGRRVVRLDEPTGPGDVVQVSDRPSRPAPRPRAVGALLSPLQLIHEDDDVLVVHKPPGLLTSTVPRERRPTALAIVRRAVLSRRPTARLGLIHRLDRDASGLLVFSKTDEAYKSLKTQFFRHSVDRVYQALVQGRPPAHKGRIETHLVERADGSVHSVPDPRARGAQHAITEYEVMARPAKDRAVVRVTLRTGRKHQIRAHLSERGWPIIGDTMYGPHPPRADRLMLAAVHLAFDHPRTGERVRFDGPPLPGVPPLPANEAE